MHLPMTESECPEVILCGLQDVQIQILTVSHCGACGNRNDVVPHVPYG